MKKATRATAFKFLRGNPQGVLATVSAGQLLTSTPITFVVTAARTIRFVTRDGTRKYEDILYNGSIALTVLDARNKTAVNITGKATIIDDPAEMRKTLSMIGRINDSRDLSPVIKHGRGDYVAIEIIPDRIQYTDYSESGDNLSSYIFDL